MTTLFGVVFLHGHFGMILFCHKSVKRVVEDVELTLLMKRFKLAYPFLIHPNAHTAIALGGV